MSYEIIWDTPAPDVIGPPIDDAWIRSELAPWPDIAHDYLAGVRVVAGDATWGTMRAFYGYMMGKGGERRWITIRASALTRGLTTRGPYLRSGYWLAHEMGHNLAAGFEGQNRGDPEGGNAWWTPTTQFAFANFTTDITTELRRIYAFDGVSDAGGVKEDLAELFHDWFGATASKRHGRLGFASDLLMDWMHDSIMPLTGFESDPIWVPPAVDNPVALAHELAQVAQWDQDDQGPDGFAAETVQLAVWGLTRFDRHIEHRLHREEYM